MCQSVKGISTYNCHGDIYSQYIRNYGSIGLCAKLGQADILRKPLVIASSGQMTETDHLPPITYTYPSYSNIPKLTLKDL